MSCDKSSNTRRKSRVLFQKVQLIDKPPYDALNQTPHHSTNPTQTKHPKHAQRAITTPNSPMRQKLLHIHLQGPVPYQVAARLQERLVSRFLASKPPSTTPAPPPHIITTSFHPVYTCGRREVGTVSPTQQAHLRADGRAEFVEALRGGQTTFHGPGQLVAYPILDLRAHKLTPRDYVCLLEKSLIATCAAFGIKAMTTENTGVWTSPDEKIAAIGVHMRRNVTSHGVGLNVGTDLWWFDRIVACGLEGKRATSFVKQGVVGLDVEGVGEEFVREVAGRLVGVEGVERVGEREVDDLLRA
ncbi:lipoyltransferase [Dothidotthia symphoricarpi CBS 119687]|uniref:lipoyl(octanoyl) transferase n=1 Tax=Dothidotthia symphoricarpi CBS 119687 TaxID=1392245 RepID=A0A6A6AJE9_9PLEO|nr:lipoyltransferase [Dothidotthia symphoricarpi CBS 119687]KAF2132069.1 lipoyltransferase [Dothidotthia symphoricarpi CBS 119687]